LKLNIAAISSSNQLLNEAERSRIAREAGFAPRWRSIFQWLLPIAWWTGIER
jgi:hypothetical protein